MCGRFAKFCDYDKIADLFDVKESFASESRWNIAPSQGIDVIRVLGKDSGRTISSLKWGLVPSWVKEPNIGNRLINARSETVSEKPSFRTAFKRRRCIVPMDGFYEWVKRAGKKQPYFIRMKDKFTFAVAGLWKKRTGPESSIIESTTIITCAANEMMKPLHLRMPVILPSEHWEM